MAGLGRRFAPDDRDRRFLINEILPAPSPVLTWKYWFSNAWFGNQGDTPSCVGYGWAHWIEDGPIGHPGLAPIVNPMDIYRGAQKNDEWDGEGYDGTSVRGGAKYLKSAGIISEYRWALTINDVLDCLLTLSPIVVGTNWYNDMGTPDENHIIHIGGSLAGGHCYVLDGVNKDRGIIRIKNSWGQEWGKRGFAYISIEDFATLLNEDGEACIAKENVEFIEQ